MNLKYNPFVSLVAALLLAVILVLTCTGCHNTAEADATEETTPPRFTVEKADQGIRIITDNETGAQYIAYIYNGTCGLTKLEG